jgi:hypothetical protein
LISGSQQEGAGIGAGDQLQEGTRECFWDNGVFLFLCLDDSMTVHISQNSALLKRINFSVCESSLKESDFKKWFRQ